MAGELPAKQFEVGSIPTGVFGRSTAGSDYIFMIETMSKSFLRWSVYKKVQLPVGITF